MLRLKKSVKINKMLLVFSVIILILITSVFPTFAASAGTDYISYPTIEMELELRYPDKAVSLNITDNIYQNNTVNHDEVIVSGRHLFTSVITKSTQSDGYLVRKGISSDYELAPVGIDITCPTFYLVRFKNGFTITAPYFKIPKTVYCEGVITYDVTFGDYIGTVTREIVSPIGTENNFVLYTFAEIDAIAQERDLDWTTCRITNWNFSSSSFNYGDQSVVDKNVLSGTWVINSDFSWIGAPINTESYYLYYIPFKSNGRNFVAISFGDTVQLSYVDTVGQVQYIEVWNTSFGWLNEEYRTLYFTDSYTWDNVVATDGVQDWDGSSYFRQWIQTNGSKRGTDNGYDGGSLVEWRYQTMFEDYSISSMDYYNTAYGSLSYQEVFDNGYELGRHQGLIDGEITGYNKAYQEQTPNATAWLGTVASGFLSFELIPGISLLSIVGVMIALSLTIVLLKFFAGG